METVTHHGRETAYRRTRPEAPGPTVLYIHGSGGGHRVWGHQYGPKVSNSPAVALDLSGHGQSEDIDTNPGEKTLRAYAEDSKIVAEATDADVLVGNSLGGAVVFQLLLETSLEPSRAVFVGTGAKLAVHEHLRTMLAEDFQGAVEFLHGDSRLFHDIDKETVADSKAQMEETGQAVTERDFLTAHQFDVRGRLGEIETPSLAIVGEHDELTPARYHEYLADEMPQCELTVIQNSAHLAMIEQPGQFNAALSTFC